MPARNPTVCDKHRAVLLSRCLISWFCCPTRTGDQLITNQAVFIDSLKEPREICPKLTLPYPAGNLHKTVILRVVWDSGLGCEFRTPPHQLPPLQRLHTWTHVPASKTPRGARESV